MGKYVRKGQELRSPGLREVVEATQWYTNGDHPDDGNETFIDSEDHKRYRCEGKVVRYYRDPTDEPYRRCPQCGAVMHRHGFIDELPRGLVVCVGDYVLTEHGFHYPMKTQLFAELFEPLRENVQFTAAAGYASPTRYAALDKNGIRNR